MYAFTARRVASSSSSQRVTVRPAPTSATAERHAAPDVRERGADRDRALGHAVQTQRELGDHAECSLRADEERAKVVARGRLDRARARPDHRSVCEHDLEREHVRAHAAVADGRRPTRVRRRHPAERRVGAGVDREPQPVLGNRDVQLAAQHARLRACLQIAGQHLEHAVQSREVERDRAGRGDHVTFERRSGAEGDDGDAVLVRPREHARDVLGRFGEDDGRGRAPRVIAEVARVQIEHRLARGHLPVSEQRAQVVGDGHQRSASCGQADAGSYRDEPVAAVAQRLEDGGVTLVDLDLRRGLEVRDVPDDHRVRAVWGFCAEHPPERSHAARVRPDHLCRYPRQRGNDRRAAERELSRLACAAVPARQHVAERKFERAPGLADRACLRPAERRSGCADRRSRSTERPDGPSASGRWLGVPQEDHVAAVSTGGRRPRGGRSAEPPRQLRRSRRARREARGRAARARR